MPCFQFARHAVLAAVAGVFASTTALAIPVPGQPPANPNPPEQGGAAADEDVGAIPPGLPTETKNIPDAMMGMQPSHTITVPQNWKFSGQTVWTGGEWSRPETTISLESPEGGGVTMLPSVGFSYMEMSDAWLRTLANAGLPPPEKTRDGVFPPEDIGRFAVDYFLQAKVPLQDVVIVKQGRDAKTEARMAKTMPGGAGDSVKLYTVVMTYTLNGKKLRDEMSIMTQIFPMMVTDQMRSGQWYFQVLSSISAPDATFDRDRPLLVALKHSARTTPQWFTQRLMYDEQLAKARLQAQQQRFFDWMSFQKQAFAERTRAYGELSDRQMQRWKEANGIGR